MSKFDDVARLLESFVERGLPGCSCAVARNGEVLWQGFAGCADKEKGTEVGPDTVFRIYSMTKVITCTAALLLYERGAFLLSDPLYEYIPEFRDHRVMVPNTFGWEPRRAKKPILVRDAFTMGLGYPYADHQSPTGLEMARVFHGPEDSGSKHTLGDFVRRMAKEVPAAFEPGSHFLYGHGHEVVGALVEAVSGKRFGAFLQEELLDPLGMKDTGFRLQGDQRERLAALYRWSEEDGSQRPEWNQDGIYQPEAVHESTGGGLLSTLEDYLTFTQMLANGGVHRGERIIGRGTIDLMRKNHLSPAQLEDFTRSEGLAGYGYGLGVRTLLDPAESGANCPAGEFGWDGMAGTYTSISPELGASIVYMHQILPNRSRYHHLRVRNAVYAAL